MKIRYGVKLPRKLKKLAKKICLNYIGRTYKVKYNYIYIHAADYAGVIWSHSSTEFSNDDVSLRCGGGLFLTYEHR